MSLRILAAAAVLVSAAVHFDLYPVVKTNDLVGPAFLLNGIAGVVIALGLLFWKHWAPPLLAIGFGICTITAFTISATAGLHGVHEHWTGFSVWAAFVAEIVAIVTGAMILTRERSLPMMAQTPSRESVHSR
jgi:hypothetical protein